MPRPSARAQQSRSVRSLRWSLLAVGFLLGAGTRLDRWLVPRGRGAGSEPAVSVPAAPAALPAGTAEDGLATLVLEIPPASAATLERARRTALERGILAPAEKVPVPARVLVDGRALAAEVRLKGDWTDHLDGAQPSYRIRLSTGVFLGMREFSIQAPRTRDHLWEWLVLESARREGLLAPRATFLRVVENGRARGIHFLEEHFTRELLEAQGRREGPIVAWDEGTLWDTLLREGSLPALGRYGFSSAVSDVAESVDPAEARVYDEKRLRASPGLAAATDAALGALEGLRALTLAELPETPHLRLLQAREALAGRGLAELVDVARLARAHALLSLFQAVHPLAWHNQRYHFDPLTARLEPILFDNMAGSSSARAPIPWRSAGLTAAFAADRAYHDGVFLELARLLAPGWLEALLAQLAPELARFERALRAEGALPPDAELRAMEARLRMQIVELRALTQPAEPLGVDARFAGDTLELWTWATTRAPVLVEGVQTAQGERLSARDALGGSGGRALGDGVTLPPDGSPVHLTFPLEPGRAAGAVLVFRPLTALDSSQRPLDPCEAGAGAGSDEPLPPALEELLAQHAFLRHDAGRNQLRVLPGSWEVHHDLVIPPGLPLVAGPGTRLSFAPGARLVSAAPLLFRGSEARPVELGPLSAGTTWGGVTVREAEERSTWEHVQLDSAGLVLERSSATLEACRLSNSRAAAALAASTADLSLAGVLVTNARTGIVGEAVTGTLVDCRFLDGEHGLVLRRSHVTLRGGAFERLAGEAVALDDGSRAHLSAGRIEQVGSGVVLRGASQAEVDGLAVHAARLHALAALRGAAGRPSTLRARGLRLDAAATCAAETGCLLQVDGTDHAQGPVERATSLGPHAREER
ncbi:MAG TPA: hypothetical protein VF530_13290 [Planctomycetota bacterium]